jgi:HD superfamily phosphohydrolase
MTGYKYIHDTVHGTIRIDPFLLQLVESPELQRLSGIKQLGFSYLVFPGANHTRLEHSLGTCHVAREITRAVGLNTEDAQKVIAAALLHDIGHGPYSHTLEGLFHSILKSEHTELTKKIITGDYDIIPASEAQLIRDRNTIPEILEGNGLKPKEVAGLVTGAEKTGYIDIFGKHRSMGSAAGDIIHSALDADQLDYLLRDSHYTGVAYGTIDLDRLLQTIAIHHDQIVVHEKGVSAVGDLNGKTPRVKVCRP